MTKASDPILKKLDNIAVQKLAAARLAAQLAARISSLTTIEANRFSCSISNGLDEEIKTKRVRLPFFFASMLQKSEKVERQSF